MVKIPRIERIEPSAALPRNERININVQDNASTILNTTRSVTSLVESGVNLYEKIEDKKADNLSKEAEIEFTKWNEENLAKLRSHQGDPTKPYAEYDQKVDEKIKEIFNRYPDLSSRVREKFLSSLNNIKQNNYLKTIKQRGAQKETYEHNLYESSVKLKKDGLSVAAGNIQKNNPDSFRPFENGLSDLKTTIAKRSLDKGLAVVVDKDSKDFTHEYTDESGNRVKIKMNDIAKYSLAKEMSQGVSDSINNLIDTNMVDEAKQVYEKYSYFIDERENAKIVKKFEKDQTNREAHAFVSKIQNLSESEQLEKVKTISDSKKRTKALEILDTNARRIEQLKERQNKKNYDFLSGVVSKRMDSNNPFYGMADLESNPEFKKVYDRLDVKSQKAIKEMVIKPKTSSEKSINKVVDLFSSHEDIEKIKDMDLNDFNRNYLVGLSQSDKKKYLSKFERLKNPTAEQERATYSRAGKLLKEQLILSGNVKYDRRGNLNRKEKKKVLEYKMELLDYIGDNVNLNDVQLKKKINEFIATRIKQENKSEGTSWFGGLKSMLFGGDEPTAPTAPTARSMPLAPVAPAATTTGLDITERLIKSMDRRKKVELKKMYMKQNNIDSIPKNNDPNFLKFAKKYLNEGQ